MANQTKTIGLLVLVFAVAIILAYLRAVLGGVAWTFWAFVPGSRPLGQVHPWDYLAMVILIIAAVVFIWRFSKRKR